MKKDFVTWLTSELSRREWSNSELARRAGLVPSTISMIISGHNRPGHKVCIAIAKAFELPQETVLNRAGLLTYGSDNVEMDDESKELVHLFQQLETKERKLALATLRAWRELDDGQ